jgi:hypothetical protein
VDKSRVKEAIERALKYFWRVPSELTATEQLAMTLMTEISRLEEGIVDALEGSPIDREKLVALLYRNRP